MFTGLIAEMGQMAALTEGSDLCKLTIKAQKILPGLKIGDSVAVNGCCLTVVKIAGRSFTADVMPETLRRTNLHQLQIGAGVNLERALSLADRLDGHIVAGHVEGVGTIQSLTPEGNALVYTIGAPAELLRYIVPKGSIAVDGISLTVTTVTQESFGISLIPHTAAETTLGYKKAGDQVNLETDILARYVEKLLGKAGTVSTGGSAAMDNRAGETSAGAAESTGVLTKEKLLENGFF